MATLRQDSPFYPIAPARLLWETPACVAFLDTTPVSPGHAHIHVIPRYRNDVPDPRGGIRWVIPARVRYW